MNSYGRSLASGYFAALAGLACHNRPGGPTHVIARIVTGHMAQTLGQTIIIENVVGAGGPTATARAARAANDGYTLITGHMGTDAASVPLYPKLAYHPEKDFEPVGLLAGTPILILARQDQDRRAGEQSHRLEILLRVIGELGIKRHGGRVRAHMPRDQRIAIIGGARRARSGGGAAGADNVLDDDGLTERLRHMAGDDARDDIGRTACRERHDHGDAARRIGLRQRLRRHQRKSGQRSQATARKRASIRVHVEILQPLNKCRLSQAGICSLAFRPRPNRLWAAAHRRRSVPGQFRVNSRTRRTPLRVSCAALAAP